MELHLSHFGTSIITLEPPIFSDHNNNKWLMPQKPAGAKQSRPVEAEAGEDTQSPYNRALDVFCDTEKRQRLAVCRPHFSSKLKCAAPCREAATPVLWRSQTKNERLCRLRKRRLTESKPADRLRIRSADALFKAIFEKCR